MSMSNYSVHDYGLVLNDLIDDNKLEDLAENEAIDYVSSFTGETFPIKDDGSTIYKDQDSYDERPLYYISVSKHPTLFKPAYENMDAVIKEMREWCDDFVERYDLPALTDNQIRDNIRVITGTYYG